MEIKFVIFFRNTGAWTYESEVFYDMVIANRSLEGHFERLAWDQGHRKESLLVIWSYE